MRVDLLQRFVDLVGPPDAAVPLFDSAMLYAAALQDGDTWPQARMARREIELAVVDHCVGREGAVDITEGVLEFLRRNRFRGNMVDYDDPRNSLMDRVLERRLGLPITLSVLAIHLAERCGVELHGLGFPGHFLVGLQLEGPDPHIWDPFRGGRRLLLDELAALYTSVVGHHVEPDSPELLAQLRPCHSRVILTRMLENIRRHYTVAQELERVADTLELLAALHPDAPRIRELLEEHPRHHHLLN
ncbi:MAG TPA: transglutaminase-like domain-containing protein [Enhygromyxa sp.]|nr:transglutaminase-like domain-containing protein [Enhygromyxa sp.]